MTQISGSNVVITGAAGGLGRLLALRMARRGARIALWDVDEPHLAGVVEETRRAGAAAAHGYACDISDRRQVCDAARRVREDLGSVRILVNNAGVVSGRSFLECSEEQLERTLRVNTLGMFWTCRAFLPEMIESGAGHLVTIASAAGTVGVARLADYCASKWAAVGFDEALRMEFRHTAPGVKTTVVCPYFLDTQMFHGVRTRFSWLLPILRGDAVADKIVAAVERDRPRLMMPWIVYFVPLLRGLLPVRLFDATAELLGINRSMDSFQGRR